MVVDEEEVAIGLVAHCHRRTNQRSLRQGHCYFQGTSWFESAVSTGPLAAGCRMTGVQQQRGKVSGGSTQQTQLQQHSCTPPQLYYILRHNRCKVPACFTNAPASHGYTEHEKQTVYISCGQGFAASSRRRVAAGPKPSNRNTRTRKGVPRQDNCNRILVPPPPYEKVLTAP